VMADDAGRIGWAACLCRCCTQAHQWTRRAVANPAGLISSG
jgi:hypothetical protein